MPYIAYEDMPRPGDSEPVTSCPGCPEGWRPLDKKYCAECYEGKIERLRHALEEVIRSNPLRGRLEVPATRIARRAIALSQAESSGERGK